jgi:hypothetical protein
MKKNIIAVLIALTAASSAHAAPTLTTSVPGSAIFFYVSNPENSAYNCVLTYRYSWDDFGTRKSDSDQSSFSVPARASKQQVLKVTRNAPNVSLDYSNLSCGSDLGKGPSSPVETGNTIYVCVGQIRSFCDGRTVIHIGCPPFARGTVQDNARSYCSERTGSNEPEPYSLRGIGPQKDGHACGYALYEVTCKP